MTQPSDEEPSSVDIDARFLLANERTLLAWVRTSLTLLVAGVGAHQLNRSGAARVLGSLLVILGALAALTGASRYREADSAIRRGMLPPRGRASLIIAYGVAALAVGVLAAVALDVRG